MNTINAKEYLSKFSNTELCSIQNIIRDYYLLNKSELSRELYEELQSRNVTLLPGYLIDIKMLERAFSKMNKDELLFTTYLLENSYKYINFTYNTSYLLDDAKTHINNMIVKDGFDIDEIRDKAFYGKPLSYEEASYLKDHSSLDNYSVLFKKEEDEITADDFYNYFNKGHK